MTNCRMNKLLPELIAVFLFPRSIRGGVSGSLNCAIFLRADLAYGDDDDYLHDCDNQVNKARLCGLIA